MTSPSSLLNVSEERARSSVPSSRLSLLSTPAFRADARVEVTICRSTLDRSPSDGVRDAFGPRRCSWSVAQRPPAVAGLVGKSYSPGRRQRGSQ